MMLNSLHQHPKDTEHSVIKNIIIWSSKEFNYIGSFRNVVLSFHSSENSQSCAAQTLSHTTFALSDSSCGEKGSNIKMTFKMCAHG